jgi:hypothetical protein
LVFLCFSYPLVSIPILFWVFFLLPYASYDPAKPFFCFLNKMRFTHSFIRWPLFNKIMEPLQLNISHLKSVLGLVTGHYYVKTPVKFVIVLCNNSA